jgi:hypothetical protein
VSTPKTSANIKRNGKTYWKIPACSQVANKFPNKFVKPAVCNITPIIL